MDNERLTSTLSPTASVFFLMKLKIFDMLLLHIEEDMMHFLKWVENNNFPQ